MIWFPNFNTRRGNQCWPADLWRRANSCNLEGSFLVLSSWETRVYIYWISWVMVKFKVSWNSGLVINVNLCFSSSQLVPSKVIDAPSFITRASISSLLRIILTATLLDIIEPVKQLRLKILFTKKKKKKIINYTSNVFEIKVKSLNSIRGPLSRPPLPAPQGAPFDTRRHTRQKAVENLRCNIVSH